jgi:hypothetical protein
MEKEEEDKNKEGDFFFQDIVKKTKTGLTFPKDLRDNFFNNEDIDVFFHLVVPNEKDKIILKIVDKEKAEKISSKIKVAQDKLRSIKPKIKKKTTKDHKIEPRWGDYFIYDFEAKEKVKSILESAFDKFSQDPINFDDAMGRVKYALISYLSSTKTENAKLYFSVLKFLVDIIEKFNQPNLIDWLYEKVIPNIESQFLYELALLDLLEVAITSDKLEKAKTFTEDILNNIDSYSKTELYNIMNSLSQLVKHVALIDTPKIIKNLIKDKLIEYENQLENVDYKIQLIEMLEQLKYIEEAFHLAKDIQVTLPPESIKLKEIRRMVKRLEEKPL